MATHFWGGTCGSARVSQDLFCRNCGRAYSSSEYLTPQDPPPKAAESPHLDKPLPPEDEPVSETLNTSTDAQDHIQPPLPTRWLDLWVGLLYLGAVASLFSLTQAKTLEEMAGTILLLLLFIPLRIYAATGLENRKLSGWQANWIVIAAEWLLYPATRMTEGADSSKKAADYTVAFLLYGLIWILPNAVYFKKRRTLFSGPPLVEGGIKGLFHLIARLPWPPVKDQRWVTIAAREGLYAAAFVSVDTAIFAIGSAFGYTNSAGIDVYALVDVGTFGAIAWGIFKFSRVASVMGVLMQIFEMRVKFAGAGVQPASAYE